MKRAIYLDEVDIDLIESALALWAYRLESSNEAQAQSLHGHFYAKHFTRRRINEMQQRLKVLKEAK